MDLDELLAFEESNDVLRFKFDHEGTLVWPLVRYLVFSKIIERRRNYQSPHARSQALTFVEKCDYGFLTAWKNPLIFTRHFDFLFFGSTAGVSFKKDGKWFGRINDYFALEHEERSLVLDASSRKRYRFPRYPKHVRTLDIINLAASVIAKCSSRISPSDVQTINDVMFLLRDSWGRVLHEVDFLNIEQVMRTHALRLVSYESLYDQLFKAIKPKVLFVEDASYGGLNAWVIAWAKRRGIMVAEPQHGCIEIPYVFCDKLINSDVYARYLPDVLLLYGQYWSNLVRSSSRRVIIGNPQFEMRSQAQDQQQNAAGERSILIVSQGTVTDILVELACQLAKNAGALGYHITYRLHPGEVPFVERYAKLKDVPGITIDQDSDIYQLINTHAHVVGCYSLTLFEAAGLKRNIYVLDNDVSKGYIPENLGTRFCDASDLLHKIQDQQNSAIADIEEVWALDWQARFRAFMQPYL